MTTPRLLLISPVRNEAAHLPALIAAVAAQTHPPACWLIVDDGSQDETLAIARAAAEQLPYLRVLETPTPESRGENEARLVRAAEARAFNRALAQVQLADFTHVAKLDGDIEPPPTYFARLLDEFRRRPSLGITGAGFAERRRRGWVRIGTPPDHVPGAVKTYSRDCFEAIGGIREHLGWDTIDETTARMRGFETGALPGLIVKHLRPWGSVGGRLRGRARYGACAYAAGYPAPWVVLRSLKVTTLPPVGLSGLAFLLGYARAAIRRVPRMEDPAYRGFVRGELGERIRRKFPRRQAVRHEKQLAEAPTRIGT